MLPDWFVVVGGAGVQELGVLFVEYKPSSVAATDTHDLYVQRVIAAVRNSASKRCCCSGRLLTMCPVSLRNIAAVVFHNMAEYNWTRDKADEILSGTAVFGVYTKGFDSRVVIAMFSFDPGSRRRCDRRVVRWRD